MDPRPILLSGFWTYWMVIRRQGVSRGERPVEMWRNTHYYILIIFLEQPASGGRVQRLGRVLCQGELKTVQRTTYEALDSTQLLLQWSCSMCVYPVCICFCLFFPIASTCLLSSFHSILSSHCYIVTAALSHILMVYNMIIIVYQVLTTTELL